MKEYLILMRGGDARMTDLTEAQTSEHMQKWGVYMEGLGKGGNLQGGQPFNHEGRLVSNDGVIESTVLTDKGESIGGYLIIKANDFDHAVELTKGCPIFEHNGSVEVRESMPMTM